MDKGKTFRDLHAETFVIPNPWDVGSAKLLSSMGFKALATTSAGHAFSRGLPDGSITFEAMIQHCREIVAATALPVSADLEKGKGDSAEAPPRPSSRPRLPALPVARSRTIPATRTSRSTISRKPWSGRRRRPRPRGP